jgi:hypothetical protein
VLGWLYYADWDWNSELFAFQHPSFVFCLSLKRLTQFKQQVRTLGSSTEENSCKQCGYFTKKKKKKTKQNSYLLHHMPTKLKQDHLVKN